MNVRGRFAPSPTGRLHLGNARTALLSWLQPRSRGGSFLLRIEDLDPDRSRRDIEEGQLADLRYLGLEWDAPPLRQSERAGVYAEALRQLEDEERVYPCFCSRAEVARASSAPHGEEGPRYPGTCATLDRLQRSERARARTPAWRFRVPPGVVQLDDEVRGPTAQDVAAEVGDFVVRRADGVASYQLAVVVDDAASGVTHVLRGDDLLRSTPRQILLQRALGLATPAYAHVPLLHAPDGARLAKRDGSTTVEQYRCAGVPPERLLGWLAGTLGWGDGSPQSLEALLASFRLDRLASPPPDGTWERLAAL